ncbi:hypothetical protein V6N11_024141 [Hibiscus sabdariffa]|uniref:Uncharacterized protein n=2 Tax=Hibiscus sabdariffa TaxID=183260 RepID=A0ABR2ACV2_9ROSI
MTGMAPAAVAVSCRKALQSPVPRLNLHLHLISLVGQYWVRSGPIERVQVGLQFITSILGLEDKPIHRAAIRDWVS